MVKLRVLESILYILILLKGKLRLCCWAVLHHPHPPVQLVGKIVGIWPKGSQSTDGPVTYDMPGMKKWEEPIRFSPLGIWFRELQELNQLGKGQKQRECQGGRVEATKSQNYMQAKVMRKQKLWVNRKLTGRKQRVKQMPGAAKLSWALDDGGSRVHRAAFALKT